MTTRNFLPTLLLAPILAACAGDAPAARATVRDSAGVRIVENRSLDSASADWWTVAAEPQVDIGMLEGPEAQTLFRVVDAVRLSDGRIAVANAGTSEVRYYDASGSHVRSTGRQGGGPGEFQRIGSLIRLGGDSLAVIDPQARRITILDGTGELVREMPAGTPDLPISPSARGPDGRWIGTGFRFGTPGDLTDGLMRNDITYVRITADGTALADTIGSFPGSETWMRINQSGGSIQSIEIMSSLPFRRTTTIVPRGDELFVATQDAPEIRVYGLDGSLRRIIRTGAATPPVTAEMVRAWAERRAASAPPERQAGLLEATLALPAGETVPPYGTIRVDRTGRLWVQDYAGLVDDPAWTVYGVDGEQIGRVDLPGDFRPFDIGDDWILGRETDELEVEHVRLYVLEVPETAR